VHKAINTELFLWLERDSTYSVYVPEGQNTHQAAMAIAEILRADANNLFPYKISGDGSRSVDPRRSGLQWNSSWLIS
jgi:hypothetical protein